MDTDKCTMLTLIKKKAGVAILISDRAYFKARNVIRDKGHYIMKRGSILQEDTVIFNVCAPNNSVKLCKAKLQNCKEKCMSPLFYLDTSSSCQKWTDTTQKKSVRTQFNSTLSSISWV